MPRRGRISTGRVKLKEANGVLSFTVPKKIVSELSLNIGDLFQCDLIPGEPAYQGSKMVVFSLIQQPKRKLQLRLS